MNTEQNAVDNTIFSEESNGVQTNCNEESIYHKEDELITQNKKSPSSKKEIKAVDLKNSKKRTLKK